MRFSRQHVRRALRRRNFVVKEIEGLEGRTLLSTIDVPAVPFDTAVAEAKNGDTINLTGNATASQQDTLADGVTVNGNTFKLTFTSAKGGLVVKDTSATIENLTITADTTLANPAILESHGNLTLTNVTVTGITINSDDCVVSFQEGHVAADGLTVSNNVTTIAATVTINGSDPDPNDKAIFAFTNTTVTGNTSGQAGNAWSTATLGADIATDSTLAFNLLNISNNNIYGNGALSLTGGFGAPAIVVTGATIEFNHSYAVNGGNQFQFSGLGGGAYIYPGTTADFTGASVIQDNTAQNASASPNLGGGGTINYTPPSPTVSSAPTPMATFDLSNHHVSFSLKGGKHGSERVAVFHQLTPARPRHVLTGSFVDQEPLEVRIIDQDGRVVDSSLQPGEQVIVDYGPTQRSKFWHLKKAAT